MNALDQLLQSISGLLKPEVLAALTAAPLILQYLKATFPTVITAQVAAVAALVLSAGLIVTQAWNTCDWQCMVLQVLLGWGWVELMYQKFVEPMAKSSNPLVPDA